MLAEIEQERDALAALCRAYRVTRLEVFGSAARGAGFDPDRSDADFLVTYSSRRSACASGSSACTAASQDS
jgi:predicted nucleotidyltransferase